MTGALAVAAAAVAVLAFAGACRRPAVRAVTRDVRWPVTDAAEATPPAAAAEWAAALERVAAEVRTGASLRAAIAAVDSLSIGAASLAAGGALRLTSRGGPLPEIAVGDDDAAYALHALGAAHDLGGPVAATLDNAAATLRERDAMRAEARAHSAPARLSAAVLTAVPLVFCAGNLATSPAFRAAWASTTGLACAAVGAALNIVGWRWMRRTIGRASA